MPSPFIGEIRLFGGTFAPLDWALCDGTLLPIDQYSTLFNLIGTTYGGNGVTNFALPDLRSRVPVHQGNYQGTNYVMGQSAGVESVSIIDAQMPKHNHLVNGAAAGQVMSPLNALIATTASTQDGTLLYGNGTTSPTNLIPQTIQQSPGGIAHTNLQPYVCVTFIISLYGIYPSQG